MRLFALKRPDAGHPQERAAFLHLPLLALALALVVELLGHKSFTGGPDSVFAFLTKGPLAFLVDVLLILLTLVPALFLRRRAFWCVLVSTVWLIAGAVNGFILLNRMTPFTMEDLTILNTGLETLPNYLSTGYILLLAAALLALAGGLALLYWKGPRSAWNGRKRLLAGGLALAVCGGAVWGSWTLAFHTRQLSTVFSNLAFAYEDYGFPYCFLQTWLNKGIRSPAGYGAPMMTEIREKIDRARDAADAAARTDVNVVYVQLESFIDPAEIKGLELSENPVPNWTALTENYSSGYLTVPVVGAGTANTECEVLTGMRIRNFGPGEYPYQTCLKDQTAESVAYDLKANGYAAHAIHNHRATFYGRNKVYANLGFDDFTTLEYMPKAAMTPKHWAKDQVLTGQILKALDTTPDRPDLVFTVSVQSHGKYPAEPLLEDPEITVEACPDEAYHYALEYYVDQIRQVDAFIGTLTERLSRREEKTVLVLYGDHLPALGLKSGDMAGGSLYRTGYVIWDNFGLPREDRDLSAYQLSAAVLGRLGITTGEMNALHQFCRDDASYTSDLRRMQYDALYGQKLLTGGTAPYKPTKLTMGMAPITITDLYQSGDAWYVSGVNFSPYCRVRMGKDLLETEYLSPWLLRLTEDPKTGDPEDLNIRVVDKHHETLSDTE